MFEPVLVERLPQVPIDLPFDDDNPFPFEIGPITDIRVVADIFGQIDGFIDAGLENSVIVEDVLHEQIFVH